MSKHTKSLSIFADTYEIPNQQDWLIYALGGDDIVIGNAGNDTIFGGDSHSTNSGNDTLYGGAGNDELFGEDGNDTLFGGSSNDMLDGGSGHDHLFGGDGNDTLIDGAGNDTFDGGAGNDIYEWTPAGVDSVSDTSGTDTLHFAGDNTGVTYNANTGLAFLSDNASNYLTWLSDTHFEVVHGGVGNDSIIGGNWAETLTGGDGNDVINAYSGDDYLDGGAGDDILNGGAGNDVLHGGSGDDHLIGSTGDDLIYGEEGNDYFVWNTSYGNDIMVGGSGDDTVDYSGISPSHAVGVNLATGQIYTSQSGNSGHISEIETFIGHMTGLSSIDATSNSHAIVVNLEEQTLSGSDIGLLHIVDVNRVLGSAYNDVIAGSHNNDTLSGAGGNDTLIGGGGNDNLYGGAGNDLYVIDASSGMDLINDTGGIDSVSFAGLNVADVVDWAAVNGDSLRIGFDDSNALVIDNYFAFGNSAAYGTGLIESLVFDDATLSFGDVAALV